MKLKVQEIKKTKSYLPNTVSIQKWNNEIEFVKCSYNKIKIKINEMASIGFIFYFFYFYKERRVILAWNWGIASVLVG